MSGETLAIEALGHGGDGVARGADGPVHVPFTLPGETVAAAVSKGHGTLISLRQSSPERVAPPCPHFGPDGENGTCGGCALQHAGDRLYRDFKRSLVVDALSARGLDAPVAALLPCGPRERRRVTLTARRTERGLLLGYNQAQSHHIVAVSDCPIASDGIVGKLAAIRAIAAAIAVNAEPFRVTVLETMTGLDLAFEGIKAIDDRQRRATVTATLAARGIARVTLNAEIVVEPVRPVLDFGGVPVSPPPGGFVQATRAAEEAMAEIVLGHVGKAKRIADLFAGSGTFALRLARIGRVHAVEGDGPALAALDHAARNMQGLKPVTVEKRDLFRRPLMTSELKVYDAVVFDPPRAGAEAQMRELAKSGVRRVAAVSCNPVTLARDLKILTETGYAIRSVTPIDQFLWSAHVEAVALLER
ncbi:class I SAM-dependent RNA methyltransferase [Ensifer soli]|uniref:class I SAM-dependent RNA methyltransferase n=1 Tax=Ciceribacter sp. sgz301302 TaxID=3342379 RepID=UPI0035B8A84F